MILLDLANLPEQLDVLVDLLQLWTHSRFATDVYIGTCMCYTLWMMTGQLCEQFLPRFAWWIIIVMFISFFGSMRKQ